MMEHRLLFMRALLSTSLSVCLCAHPTVVFGEEADGVRPLLRVERDDLLTRIPSGAWLLDDPTAIEAFLASLDGGPPDWAHLYGSDGHVHDDALFAMNRTRDLRRQADAQGLVTFLWPGELSEYDEDLGGFRVAIGPKMIPTRWGLVRFKPDGLPSNLVAVPEVSQEDSLQERARRGDGVAIDVAMTGRLIPEESIIYDYAHDQPGRGVVMPVVRIERVDFLRLH